MAQQAEKIPGVLPTQLKKARKSLGLSIDKAASLLGLSTKQLEAWEAGGTSPDADQLWDLAEKYGRPVSYFFVETPDIPERQDFRLHAYISRPVAPEAFRGISAQFEELCRAQFSLQTLLNKGIKLHPSLLQARRINDSSTLAKYLRNQNGLSSDPIQDLRQLLEGWGINVFVVSVEVEGFSGTSWWHPDYGPAMLINRRDSEGRRVFTMAHELAHLLWTGDHVICGYLTLQRDEEKLADQFAATFLIPADHLQEFVKPLLENEELAGWSTEDKTLDKVARKYKVSREAASWRLENLRLLPKGFTAAKRQTWVYRLRATSGARWKHRVEHLGVRFISLAREAYNNGLLSRSALAETLGIDMEQVSEWLRSGPSSGD